MKKLFHPIYRCVGKIYCFMRMAIWNIRDKLFPPKERTVLFIAHPDDDTLFFHTLIKKEKPYVVLLTMGWSFVRMYGFEKNMRAYGVRYRAFDLESRDNNIKKLKKYITNIFKNGQFTKCVTHNAEGEYGHEMHKRIHKVVKECAKCSMWCTESSNLINRYPLPEKIILEKENIFNKYYKTELFVLDMYSNWVKNEHLLEVSNNL